jgi:hypothetical protein
MINLSTFQAAFKKQKVVAITRRVHKLNKLDELNL